MRALVLCGGLGTRLGKLTQDKPKCLIDVGGRPIIDHVLWQLSLYGIHNVIVNVHHKYDQIIKYLGVDVLYSYEPKLLNSAGSVKNLADWFDEDILVVNGDTISNANYKDFIDFSMLVHYEDTCILTNKTNGKCAGAYLISTETAQTLQRGKTIDECLNKENVRYFIQPGLVYFDCGTAQGLLKARHYAQKIS